MVFVAVVAVAFAGLLFVLSMMVVVYDDVALAGMIHVSGGASDLKNCSETTQKDGGWRE